MYETSSFPSLFGTSISSSFEKPSRMCGFHGIVNPPLLGQGLRTCARLGLMTRASSAVIKELELTLLGLHLLIQLGFLRPSSLFSL